MRVMLRGWMAILVDDELRFALFRKLVSYD